MIKVDPADLWTLHDDLLLSLIANNRSQCRSMRLCTVSWWQSLCPTGWKGSKVGYGGVVVWVCRRPSNEWINPWMNQKGFLSFEPLVSLELLLSWVNNRVPGQSDIITFLLYSIRFDSVEFSRSLPIPQCFHPSIFSPLLNVAPEDTEDVGFASVLRILYVQRPKKIKETRTTWPRERMPWWKSWRSTRPGGDFSAIGAVEAARTNTWVVAKQEDPKI